MALQPKPLPDGGTIAVIAPSSRGDADQDSIAALEGRGFKVRLHPQTQLTDRQCAGTHEQRVTAIMDVFADKGVDAVMALRGGNRAAHLLERIDWDIIKNNPKPLIGFSDMTALLNAIYAKTGLSGYHGPVLTRVSKGQPQDIDQMIAALQGKGAKMEWKDAATLNGGKCEGPMIGGNLSVFAALCGTPYMPKTSGAILFLEDTNDQLSRYDRMLMQLKLAGIFDSIAGLVFGVMDAEKDSSLTPFGFSTAEILREHTKDLKIPVVIDAPFGHSGPLCTLPVGGIAKLDADARTIEF